LHTAGMRMKIVPVRHKGRDASRGEAVDLQRHMGQCLQQIKRFWHIN
jgi:hypothetical protein